MVKARKEEKVVIKEEKETVKNWEIEKILKYMEIGESISYKNLSVYPVYSGSLDPEQKVAGLKTLQEAFKDGIVEVKETGVVKQLTLVNKSKEFKILLMAGDIVKGGAQNRVINASMVIDEEATVTVPTTCVQQHRWNVGDKDAQLFKSVISMPMTIERAHGLSLKDEAFKMLANCLAPKYEANQGEMWDETKAYLCSVGSLDHTNDLTNSYIVKEEDVNEYKKAFEGKLPLNDKDVIGFVLHVGKVTKVDVCCDNEMFLAHVENLMNSAYIDAVNLNGKSEVFSQEDVVSFVNSILAEGNPAIKTYPTPNENGTTASFESNVLRGTALIYKGEVIHLTAFSK
jgi:hypothetical protein